MNFSFQQNDWTEKRLLFFAGPESFSAAEEPEDVKAEAADMQKEEVKTQEQQEEAPSTSESAETSEKPAVTPEKIDKATGKIESQEVESVERVLNPEDFAQLSPSEQVSAQNIALKEAQTPDALDDFARESGSPEIQGALLENRTALLDDISSYL